jgi:hypothetical protein
LWNACTRIEARHGAPIDFGLRTFTSFMGDAMTVQTESVIRALKEEVAGGVPDPKSNLAHAAGGDPAIAQTHGAERAAPSLIERFLHNLMLTLGAWSV